jgi:hypothetical protein
MVQYFLNRGGKGLQRRAPSRARAAKALLRKRAASARGKVISAETASRTSP